MSIMLNAALAYARQFRWPVFPIHSIRDGRCTCPNRACVNPGKHPRTVHGLLDASLDEAQIRRWWHEWPDANIGIATGADSNVIVLDVDPRHGGDESLAMLEREHRTLPDTVEAITGGGGRHVLFSHPGVAIANKAGIAAGLDIRGHGGYIVVAPSLHVSGNNYIWEASSRPGDLPLAPMPAWLVELARADRPSNGKEHSVPADPNKKIIEGERNVKLTSLAGAMRRRGAGINAIEAALIIENGEKCEPPLSDGEVRGIARSIIRYEPEVPCPRLIMPKGSTACAEWLDTYIEYARSISPMTPPLFHESGGLWLLSTAIARRLVLPMAFGNVYPNLFILWLADTTLYRKTTGQAVPRSIAARVCPYLIAPQDCTPEALLNDMAGNEPQNWAHLTTSIQDAWKAQRNYSAQRGLMMDEMSGLLASAGRDYNAGLIEAYLRFYDCEEQYTRSTRGQGWLVVKNAYVSIMGASTPAAMASHISAERLWAMGWWPRFAMLTPPEARAQWQEPVEVEEPLEIARGLHRLINRLPRPIWPDAAKPVRVQIARSAIEVWNVYNKALSYDMLTDELDKRLYGTYGRLPMLALKVAMILAAVDWDRDAAVPTIDDNHIRRAMEITERWRESAHRTLTKVMVTEYHRHSTRMLRLISKAGKEGITFRDLARQMSDVKPADVQDTLNQLKLASEIMEEERRPKGAGKPKIVYMMVTE